MYPHALFPIFGREVNLYGILIAVGILACLAILYIFTTKKGMPNKVQDYIFFMAIIGIGFGFFAAAVVQAFFNYLKTGVYDLGSGITVMGGLLGGAAAFLIAYFGIGRFIFKGKDKGLHVKNFNTLFSVAPICILVAHGFGRLGCLCAGCCHGMYLGDEYVFGGIWMRGTVNDIPTWGYYAPAQLYEALFLFVLAVVLSVMFFKGCNITMAIYLISYGVWRFCIEFIRTDNRGQLIPGLSPSQWQSFIFIGLGAGLIIFYVIRKIPLWLKKQKDLPVEPETAEISDENQPNDK